MKYSVFYQNCIFVINTLLMAIAYKHLIILLLPVLIFLSCEESEAVSQDSRELSVENNTDSISSPIESEETIENEVFDDPLEFTKMFVQKIESAHFSGWEEFSADQLFFSPYAFVDTNSINKILSTQLDSMYESSITHFWGFQDGTGDSLNLAFGDYVNRHLADFDLSGPNTSYKLLDQPVARGNELHNAHQLYPDHRFVEIHVPSTDEMGMNWKSLILVMSQGEELKLLGFVHYEWTI